MASIYLHIPFCKQACYYCDFYFSTSLKRKDEFLEALKLELVIRKTFFLKLDKEEQYIQSIYFGGGTPSLVLTGKEIKNILKIIHDNYNVVNTPEITLEANPDDLSESYLNEIRASGVNRLSIGIQSFNNSDLIFLNRSHNSAQAKDCVIHASNAGITDVSIDLIYGIQSSTFGKWKNNLSIVSQLPICHLSCYCLTIEPKTVFYKWISEKRIENVNDENISTQFNYLVNWALEHEYEHYEISNFCKNNKYSKHNTSYWKNTAYLGVGPSAHSYNLKQRFWNASNNSIYIKGLSENKIPNQTETLSEQNQYNEYVMTGLRTKWGVDISVVSNRFKHEIQNHFNESIREYIDNGCIIKRNNTFIVSNKGKLISDKIITSLIIA